MHATQLTASAIYNRVPKVTVDFWLIKLMAVTVGETAADFLNANLGLGLSKTSLLMSGLLLAALMVQFAQKRYVPWIYWVIVVWSALSAPCSPTTLSITSASAKRPPASASPSPSRRPSPYGIWSKGRFPFIPSTPPGANCFTGWLSC